MRNRFLGLVAALMVMGPSVSEACHRCGHAPCVMPPPRPAYKVVTDMVPYTVMKHRVRTEFVEQTCTVMAKVPHTTFVPKTIVVPKPVFDTTYVTRVRTVCRPVVDTFWVTKTDTVCRPVPTTREVTSYCMQPTATWTEAVSSCGGCLGGLCHKHGTGVNYVTKTQFTAVPYTRLVTDVQMVTETICRQVPITRTRFVPEQKCETVPVTHCRYVPEVKTIEVPCTTFTWEPKTITKMVPVRVPEIVPVTCYKPVKRIVPCEPAFGPMGMGYPMEGWAPASAQGLMGGPSGQILPGPASAQELPAAVPMK